MNEKKKKRRKKIIINHYKSAWGATSILYKTGTWRPVFWQKIDIFSKAFQFENENELFH